VNDRSSLYLLLLWLVLPFAAISVYAYAVLRADTEANEANMLLRQVAQIAERLETADPDAEAARDWGRLLTQGMLLRWVDANGRVRYAVTSDAELEKRQASFRYLRQPAVVEKDSDRVYVMAPLFQNNRQIGAVELGIRWTWLTEQWRNFALGLALVSLASLAVTGGVAAVFGRMRSQAGYERHRRYLADLFHELRTPLTVIESYAAMMKRWAGSDPKLREEATAVIAAEASRLRRLATRLLSGHSWDEKETALRVVTFDLDEQLRNAAEQLAAAFARTIRIVRPDGGRDTGSPKPLRIVGDPEQLQQLWIILLDNALKYSDDAIKVALEQREDKAIVTVSDRGLGIPQRELPRLFDRHYRGKGVRRRRSGSGLGLSIAGDIVRRHGGTIQIDSSLHVGTDITVTLPLR
jgi:signal transduction histidine kinase